MISAKAICEEFSEEVYCLYEYNIQEPPSPTPSGEIKCSLQIKYFTPLLERLRGAGYCCTQVQKNLGKNTCTAWFEPIPHD